MTRFRHAFLTAILAGSICFLWLGTFFQRTTVDLFASPDETAVMAQARNWSWTDGFRLPTRLPADLADVPGLHARSVVREGDALVPVGFLGMPIIVAAFEAFGRGFGAYAAALLALSAAYPLYALASRHGRRVAVLTVAFFLSFPVVLLYANRGLFPNLPVVALAIWGIWACLESGKNAATNVGWGLLAGLAVGLALIIRPVEAVWMLPWIVWASSIGMKEGKRGKGFVISASLVAVIVCAWAWMIARQTYGASHGLFPIGYWIRETGASAVASTPNAPASIVERAIALLPFGIHPRTLVTNIRVYLGTAFGVWVGLALLGASFDLKRNGLGARRIVVYGLIAWTALTLLFLYGQSAYTDNINGGATIGNSFLRYLLPLAPIIAFGCALAVDRLFDISRRGYVFAPTAAALLISFGIVTAFASDDESILRTRYELARYGAIRLAAEELVPRGSIIISERSDKIFASGPHVAVSPIPDRSALERVNAGRGGAYYFTRTFGPDDGEPVLGVFPGAIPVFTLQNETMYKLLMTKDGSDESPSIE